MTEKDEIPGGGIDLRKYAAMALALGTARGALFNAMAGDIEGARRALDITSLSKIAEALNCSENDLAIDWDEHLTRSELDRLKGFY